MSYICLKSCLTENLMKIDYLINSTLIVCKMSQELLCNFTETQDLIKDLKN